ncbi:MAG: VWA domain-containing protein [Treponema sp.]|nr:VWA domain-containing protein [Treponema sp.]
MKQRLLLLMVLGVLFPVRAEDTAPLAVGADDIRLEQERVSGGFHLYVRKKPSIQSIMLTETTKDPSGRSDNYAYRALEWNPINGDERRILDGEFLSAETSPYALIDSTPEPDAQFGEAFHIYIPHTVTYGYAWTRHGTVTVGRGTFINIRAFSEAYCDYRGSFSDNPFSFDASLPPPVSVPAPSALPVAAASLEGAEPAGAGYHPDARRAFQDIARTVLYSHGSGALAGDIARIVSQLDPRVPADIVFVLDTTGSMKDDLAAFRQDVLSVLGAALAGFSSFRLGLILYRDYGETGYNYHALPVKRFAFTDSVETFSKHLHSFTIYGTEGGDVPEAVYEGIFAAIDCYDWRTAAQRTVIVIGDAPPHPEPRGTKKYSRAFVQSLARERGITIHAVLLPAGAPLGERSQ